MVLVLSHPAIPPVTWVSALGNDRDVGRANTRSVRPNVQNLCQWDRPLMKLLQRDFADY